MTNDKKYDLEERTTLFSESIIEICKNSPKNEITMPLINQLIRSGTSIGANYMEANGASSKKDFKNKIFTCKKEAKETRYWLRLLSTSTKNIPQLKEMEQEAKELTLIFQKLLQILKINN